jgi:hypothetical protein
MRGTFSTKGVVGFGVLRGTKKPQFGGNARLYLINLAAATDATGASSSFFPPSPAVPMSVVSCYASGLFAICRAA